MDKFDRFNLYIQKVVENKENKLKGLQAKIYNSYPGHKDVLNLIIEEKDLSTEIRELEKVQGMMGRFK